MGYVALICATNKINKNVPENIVRGILNFTTQEVIVPRVLAWDFCLGIRGDNIKSVNFQIKVVKEELNNNFTYIDTDHTWETSGGALNMNLYYKYNLYLIEKGNEKLAKAITTEGLKTAATRTTLQKSAAKTRKGTST